MVSDTGANRQAQSRNQITTDEQRRQAEAEKLKQLQAIKAKQRKDAAEAAERARIEREQAAAQSSQGRQESEVFALSSPSKSSALNSPVKRGMGGGMQM